MSHMKDFFFFVVPQTRKAVEPLFSDHPKTEKEKKKAKGFSNGGVVFGPGFTYRESGRERFYKTWS